MPDLSPAAQAMLDAFRSSHTGQGCLAAALRALADLDPPHDLTTSEYNDGWGDAMATALSIATELSPEADHG